MADRLGYVSFAYAIGCVCVVLGHSYPLGDAAVPPLMDRLRLAIYAFHMPLFFIF